MALGINTVYDDGTRIEDVMRNIICLTPTDTPFMTGIKKGGASNVLHEWLNKTLTTRQDNAKAEGATFSYAKRSLSSRSVNVTQIFDKTYDVSSTTRWVKKLHKTNDTKAELLADCLAEIATDIEHALLRGSKCTGNDTVARRMAGAVNYITTNYTAVSSGTTLSESFFTGLLELAWSAGGDPDEIYVNSFLKRVISGFDMGAVKNMATSDKRLVSNIDVVSGDFGIQKIFKSRDMLNATNNCTIMAIDNAKWKMAVGEEVHELSSEEVAQTSHSTKGVIRGELTLESLAENGNAIANNIDKTFPS
jgi:hypothetical protein